MIALEANPQYVKIEKLRGHGCTLSVGQNHTRHSWNTVPESWESLGYPLAGTAINLYVALNPTWRAL